MESIKHKGGAVLFDLDNTLFDHNHSLRSAMGCIQGSYDSLKSHDPHDLVSKYNNSLEKAYDEYLRNEISRIEADSKKVRLFFSGIGLPEPDHKQILEFLDIYKSAYRNSRRATMGSVEMLVRLRENGFRLAIVANGQLKDQLEKAETIGVRHLVDKTITSEEVGCYKRDTKLPRSAIKRLGGPWPQKSYMVGDFVDSDIKAGLESGLNAILYSPITVDPPRRRSWTAGPVIHSMSELPRYLNFSMPQFTPRIYSRHSQVIAEGIGMDVITEPRNGLHLTKEAVNGLSTQMAGVFQGISEEDHVSSISRLEAMVRTVAKASSLTDETAIRILYSGQSNQPSELGANFPVHITERRHSVRVAYGKCVFTSGMMNETYLRECIELLQSYCDNLMRDYPRAALRNLRSVMLILAKVAGIRTCIVIEGRDIDLDLM